MIATIKKELIAQTIIKILVSRFSSFPDDSSNNNRNAPPRCVSKCILQQT